MLTAQPELTVGACSKVSAKGAKLAKETIWIAFRSCGCACRARRAPFLGDLLPLGPLALKFWNTPCSDRYSDRGSDRYSDRATATG